MRHEWQLECHLSHFQGPSRRSLWQKKATHVPKMADVSSMSHFIRRSSGGQLVPLAGNGRPEIESLKSSLTSLSKSTTDSAQYREAPSQVGYSASQPTAANGVMGVLNEINTRWGRGTLRAASVVAEPDWAMHCDWMNQRFTTKLAQRWVAKARRGLIPSWLFRIIQIMAQP